MLPPNPPESRNPSSSENSKPQESTQKPHHQTTVATRDSLLPKKMQEEEKNNTSTALTVATEGTVETESSYSSGRERLKRHRVEVAGRVWIPDMWGQEAFLKDWIDCGVFDASLVNSSIMSARAALVQEPRTPNSTTPTPTVVNYY
ncbi:protein BIC1 [Sesamum alatum]|uniref:Protein BIC1 n=1 Tax=Sesamum alatum TaxID=300844 RepID=A0AAE1XWQ8_9LAMI|nr:protein BIC1 [Sesamum alatum]